MNPDVNSASNPVYSDLQLQLLQQLRITPLHSQLRAVTTEPEISSSAATAAAESTAMDWQLADPASALVQDILQLLQQLGVSAHWFYRQNAAQVQLTPQGLYSAPPETFRPAVAKQSLWQQICAQLPDPAMGSASPETP